MGGQENKEQRRGFNKESALKKWMGLCSRREYAGADIEKKLSLAGANRQEIDEIMQILRKESFQSDVRYAEAYVREKALISGWGVKKIVYHLKTKGIESEIVSEAVEKLDRDKSDDRGRDVLRRKWISLSKEEDRNKKREKFLRFGLSRGYDLDYLLRIYNELNVTI